MKLKELEKKFNKKFKDYILIHSSKPFGISKNGVWEFILSEVIPMAKEEERIKVIQEAVDLSDSIELQNRTEFEEWRAFKQFRNTLRDILEELRK